MSTDLTPLTGYTAQLFADDLASFLAVFEHKKASPYVDGKGIPSVGVGINLTVRSFTKQYLTDTGIANQDEVIALENVFQKKGGYASTAVLTTAIDNVLTSYGGIQALPPLSTSGANNGVENLFQQIVVGDANGDIPTGGTAILTQFQKSYVTPDGFPSNLLTSQEGVAVLSLYFNNPGC